MFWAPAVASAGSNILGGIGAQESSDAYYRSLKGQIPGLTSAYANDVNAALAGYDPYARMGTASLADLQAWRPEQMGQFSYNKDVNSFLDPSMAFQNQQQQAALAESQLGKGRVLGGAAAKELTQLATNQAQTDYQNSWNRMQQDRTNVYSQFLNEFNARNNASLSRLNQLQNMSATGFNATGQISAGKQNIAANNFNAGMSLAQARAQNKANSAGFGWNMAAGLLGSAGQLGGAYQQQQNFNTMMGAQAPQVQAPQMQMGANMQLPIQQQYTPQQQMSFIQNDMNPTLLQSQQPLGGNMYLGQRFP